MAPRVKLPETRTILGPSIPIPVNKDVPTIPQNPSSPETAKTGPIARVKLPKTGIAPGPPKPEPTSIDPPNPPKGGSSEEASGKSDTMPAAKVELAETDATPVPVPAKVDAKHPPLRETLGTPKIMPTAGVELPQMKTSPEPPTPAPTDTGAVNTPKNPSSQEKTATPGPKRITRGGLSMVTAHLFGPTRNRNPPRPEVKTAPGPPNPVPAKADVPKVLEKPSPPEPSATLEPTPAVRNKAPKAKASLKPPTPAVPTTINAPKIVKNTSPWDDIPSDLLLEIMSYLRDDRYAVLNLIRVCTYWRQVLVECPLNWTQISSLYPPQVFKSWIQRSKNLPIDAEICSFPPRLLSQLRSRTVTFRSLRCTLNKKNFTTLFDGLTKVSPNIQRLELYRRNADQGPSPFRLKIISGGMPTLKDLRLMSIDLTPEVLKLRHLVNLELTHPFPSMTDTLDLIAMNPLLETVTLSVKCEGKTDPRPDGAVAIPFLRSLKFNFYSPLPLFHKLSVPKGATIMFSPWTDAEECEAILPESLEHLHNLSEIKNLYIQRRSGYWVKASGPSGEVRFEGKCDPELEIQRLPLQFVEKFRYTDIRESTDLASWDPSWLSNIFDRSRSLQALVLDSCALATMKDIFGLLSRPNHSPAVLSLSQSLPCPALSMIVVEAPHDGTWDDWATPFLQMLRDRAAAGLQLKKVRILSKPRAKVPRQDDERRKEMAKLVSWVEVKSLLYEGGKVDEQRARELLEWQHDVEGFKRDDSSVRGPLVDDE